MNETRLESNFWRKSRPPGLTVDQAEEIDRRCDRFEAGWRKGDRPRHEDHLQGADGTFRAALEAELVAVELEWRRRLVDIAAGNLAPAEIPSGLDEFRTRGGSVLDSIATAAGPIPRVLLRDTDGGDEPPLHRPGGVDHSSIGSRYRIDGEIARGGMGSVLKGRDPDLGREVALKVLREDFRDNVEMVRRFVEEAQIGGQLQHPGIVPIYEMGTFGDLRPFFSMKLVKGDTLAKLLANRKDPVDGLPRFLSIFESIAQTVAYSHARGVIHRDLKPSNVMVGSFGEVQVMDWGLAKVLPRGGVVDDAAAGKVAEEETVIATARSGLDDSDLSRAGSVMGTPSYMAPEQARGEIDRVDERADVFALGSILCEILTGQPAFIGRSGGEIQRKAAVGDLTEALARLDSGGTDAELLALAKECLVKEPEDRPRTAGAVSDRIGSYLSGVQGRLRRAEMESVEERARRRLTTVAAAALILLGLVGGGGYTWNERQKAERLAKTTRGVGDALADAARLRGEALSSAPGDEGRWSAALSAAKRAEGLLAQGDADASLKGRVDSLMVGLESERAASFEKARQIEIDRVLLADLESVRGNRADHRDLKRANVEYAEMFRRAGLDLDRTEPEDSGRWLAKRADPIEMAGYLDDWAFVRRAEGLREVDWQRLVATARVGDPDPWRDTLRSRFGKNDPASVAEFHRMAADLKLEDQPAPGLLLLARQLKFGCGDGPGAADVLRRAARRYPDDFRVHFELAYAPGAGLESRASSIELFPNPEDAVRHLTTALSIRPKSISTRVALSVALIADGKYGEAEAESREAVRLKPDEAWSHAILGNSLRWQGKHGDAEIEAREAVRFKPDDARCHDVLAVTLKDARKFDEAAAEFREAIRLKPDYFEATLDLADALQRKGDYAAALTEIRSLRERVSGSITNHYHPAEWIAKIESMATLDVRLPAILKGEDRPKDAAERLDLAQICVNKKLYRAAARFWSEALEADPKLADDRRVQHRYNAACVAALAVAGKGKDDPPPDEQARARLRALALDWLKLELAAWSGVLDTGTPKEREGALSAIRWWTRDTDLATIRDADALAKLPEPERNDWRAFWGEHEALIRKGSQAGPQ